jgi:hypothetical protein
MQFKKCEQCEDWHFDSEECRPPYIVTPCETGIPTTVRAVSHWHAARYYLIKTSQHITSSRELLDQPDVIVDVLDENGKEERYVISVEYCASHIEIDKNNTP